VRCADEAAQVVVPRRPRFLLRTATDEAAAAVRSSTDRPFGFWPRKPRGSACAGEAAQAVVAAGQRHFSC
jgi:hypothetical protein